MVNILDDSSKKASKNDILKGRKVIDSILSDDIKLLKKRSHLLKRFEEFGTIYQTWSLFEPFQNYVNSSMFGTLQIPTEYVDFLMHCIEKKPSTFCEVGCHVGGFAIFTSAVLSRFNDKFQYTVIDIEDIFADWDHYKNILPIDKRIPSTAQHHAQENFDIVFIDADHSYDGLKRDFLSLGRHAKILCGFHDINGTEYDHLDGGTRRAWNDLKVSYREKAKILEIAHMKEEWMGIGVIEF
ncbi:MAG: class I SAM-dependent methyltransferase [Cellvibrionales bacterium]|nr:class I SAM-dependent methyltransferase [Cellvibrionales bacterium]